jgi:succinyl-CoA synthetase beta subunit
MRFFEYESRAIVAKAGIPVTKHGFAKTPEEAERIAEQIAGPVVIKSQVLTGGRMKAGGVQFADTPEDAARQAEHVLDLEINGHMPRGVLVDSRQAVKHEYYAGVVWDGIRKRPVMLFSDMGGIDIEEVAEQHPDHVARRHFSALKPFSDWEAKQLIASIGVTGPALNRLTPIVARLARLFLQYDMTLAEINPLGELEDGSFVALDAHMDMENEARPRQQALLRELGVGDEETRLAREPTPFELAGEQVDSQDHRGVAGNVTEFDGNLGLVIGAGGGSLTLFDAVRAHGGDPAVILGVDLLAGEFERRRLARLPSLLVADPELLQQRLLPGAGLVLHVHVRVEGDEGAVLELAERIDLGERHVVAQKQPRQPGHDRSQPVQRRA